MFRKICLLLVLLLSFASLTFLPAQTAKADSELQAMKSDVQRMHALLNLMRTNLAFVNAAGPIKRQFQLEADMWQVTLDQMDRRIAATEDGHQNK